MLGPRWFCLFGCFVTSQRLSSERDGRLVVGGGYVVQVGIIEIGFLVCRARDLVFGGLGRCRCNRQQLRAWWLIACVVIQIIELPIADLAFLLRVDIPQLLSWLLRRTLCSLHLGWHLGLVWLVLRWQRRALKDWRLVLFVRVGYWSRRCRIRNIRRILGGRGIRAISILIPVAIERDWE